MEKIAAIVLPSPTSEADIFDKFVFSPHFSFGPACLHMIMSVELDTTKGKKDTSEN
jgi:hypothetical protein